MPNFSVVQKEYTYKSHPLHKQSHAAVRHLYIPGCVNGTISFLGFSNLIKGMKYYEAILFVKFVWIIH